jgi:hypothetical protein
VHEATLQDAARFRTKDWVSDSEWIAYCIAQDLIEHRDSCQALTARVAELEADLKLEETKVRIHKRQQAAKGGIITTLESANARMREALEMIAKWLKTGTGLDADSQLEINMMHRRACAALKPEEDE